MSESLFDIFGERLTREFNRGLPRQPLSNNENIGKLAPTGPVKPNEPLKKAGEAKKSFLSNTGKALRDIQTPVQKVYSPRTRNVESSAKKLLSSQIIYSDELDQEAKNFYEELEFTRPTYRYDNYHTDFADYILGPEPQVLDSSPPSTPPPVGVDKSMEFDYSYEDDFFTDDFNNNDNLPLPKTDEVGPFEEDDFPALYEDSD